MGRPIDYEPQDAQECLSTLLSSATTGMATRLCAGHGGLDHEGILLCALDEEAQVAVGAPPIDMRPLILTTLTADRALTAAPPLLILRVENIADRKKKVSHCDPRSKTDPT